MYILKTTTDSYDTLQIFRPCNGDDRLLAFLRDCSFESTRQVIETITAEVEAHRNGAEPNDDLTMMCLNVK